MSRLRTGHGPDDWLELPPAENSHRFSTGGESINLVGRKAANVVVRSNSEIARAEARKAKRSEPPAGPPTVG